jgi:hypothetical protein
LSLSSAGDIRLAPSSAQGRKQSTKACSYPQRHSLGM